MVFVLRAKLSREVVKLGWLRDPAGLRLGLGLGRHSLGGRRAVRRTEGARYLRRTEKKQTAGGGWRKDC